MSSDPIVWLAAVLTLASFSWVVKMNPAYTFCERLFIGLGAGYWITVGWTNLYNSGIRAVMDGRYLRIIPILLGILLLSSIVTPWHRNRQLPNMVIIGIGTGLALRTVMQSQFIRQIQATWMPLNNPNNIIILVGTVASMAYFVFTFATREDTGAGRVRNAATAVGMWVLMACFGASFGTAVQARISTFVARFQFLFGEWLGFM